MTRATVAWDQILFAIRGDVHARWEWYNPARELLHARFSQAEVIKRRKQYYPAGDDAAPTWKDINPLACIDEAVAHLLERCEKPVPSDAELQALLLIAVSLFFSDEMDYGLPWGNLPWGRAVTGERTASFGYSRDTAADIAEKKYGDRFFRTVERAWYRLEQGRRAALQPVVDAPGGHVARTAPNTFRVVFPHRTLPTWIQDVLWNACQLVRGDQEQFRGLVERLDLEYSETAVLARLLADSKREFRLAVWDLRHPQERSFTFPRRMALRATNPRIPRKRRLKWLQRFYSVRQLAHISPEDIVHLSHHPEQVEDRLVELTLKEAESGGWRLENDKLIQPNDSRARGVPIDRTNVKTVWRSLDQLYLERREELREEPCERNAQCHREAKDRAFRLRLAVKDAIESDLVAGGDEQTQAHWVILLACLLSDPQTLALPGEFASWQWKGQGDAHAALAGGHWLPGRESVLFSPFGGPHEAVDRCVFEVDIEALAALLQHSLILVGAVDPTVSAADAKQTPTLLTNNGGTQSETSNRVSPPSKELSGGPTPSSGTTPDRPAEAAATPAASSTNPLVSAPSNAKAATPPTSPEEIVPTHNTDFTMVNWYGVTYHFGLGVQSAAVEALWEENQKSGLGLHQATIAKAVDSERDAFRMDMVFRTHPAYRKMIVPLGAGKYGLRKPKPVPRRAKARTKKKTGKTPK